MIVAVQKPPWRGRHLPRLAYPLRHGWQAWSILARRPFERSPSGIRCEGKSMKTVLLAAVAAFTFVAGIAVADAVRDWHDLDKVHDHVVEAIHELDRARAANHYDMAGHGAKAEQLLHEAEHELHEAVEASKAAR